MITYAGFPLLTESKDGQLQDWLDRFLPLSDLSLWGWPRQNLWNYLTDSADDYGNNITLPRMNWPPRWRVRLNSLYWPTGATRWSQFSALCTGDVLQQILNVVEGSGDMVGGGGGSQMATANNPQQLILGPDQLSADAWPLQPNQFTTDSNGVTAISTKMYLLQPHPVTMGNDASGTKPDSLWILPLVDERYFWQWRQADVSRLIQSQNSTVQPGPVTFTWWSQILSLLGSQTDSGSITVSSLNSNYAMSDAAYAKVSISQWIRPGILSMMLDAAALNCGLRIVRGVDGTVAAISPADSTTRYLSNTTPGQNPAIGKLILGGDFSQTHRAGSQPASIDIAFTPHPDANPSLPVQNLKASDATLSTQSGGFGTGNAVKRFLTTARPIDATTAKNTAKSVGQDYYLWRQTAFDLVYSGIVPWNPTGYDDASEFRLDWDARVKLKNAERCGAYVFHTRIQSLPPSCEFGQIVVDNEPELAWLVADFPTVTAPIFGSTAGGAGTGIISLSGNYLSTLNTAGVLLRLLGTGGIDGYYRVKTTSFSSGVTNLVVNEAVASTLGAGGIGSWSIPSLSIVGSVAGGVGGSSWNVSGNWANYFPINSQIETGRTGTPAAATDGTWTVSANLTYSSVSNQTTIPVSQSIPTAVAQGYLRGHYPSPNETPLVFPGCSPAQLNFGEPFGAMPPSFVSGLPETIVASLGKYLAKGNLVRAQRQSGVYQAISTSRSAFLYAGGGSGVGATFSRIDPGSGTTLWTVTRNAQLRGLKADAGGYAYTSGAATGSGSATAPIVLAVAGSAGFFATPGNHTATFIQGLAFTVSGSTGGHNDGSYTVLNSIYQTSSGDTNIYVTNVPFNDSTGTITYNTGNGAGSTHEKWTSAGSLVWSAQAGYQVTAIGVDSFGNVYTGTLQGTSLMLRKWGPTGAEVTGGNFPVTVKSSVSTAETINGIAIDPVNGRIAVAFGILGQNPSGTGMLCACFNGDGSVFTLQNAGNIGTGWSVAFDWLGYLYFVGQGGPNSTTTGGLWDPTGTFVANISWPVDTVTDSAGAFGVVTDYTGRAIIAGQIGRVPSDNLGAWTAVVPFTIQVRTHNPQPFFQVRSEDQCYAVACDQGGEFFVAGFTYQGGQATLYAFDATGILLWSTPFWSGLNSSKVEYGNGNFLLIAAA